MRHIPFNNIDKGKIYNFNRLQYSHLYTEHRKISIKSKQDISKGSVEWEINFN